MGRVCGGGNGWERTSIEVGGMRAAGAVNFE